MRISGPMVLILICVSFTPLQLRIQPPTRYAHDGGAVRDDAGEGSLLLKAKVKNGFMSIYFGNN